MKLALTIEKLEFKYDGDADGFPAAVGAFVGDVCSTVQRKLDEAVQSKADLASRGPAVGTPAAGTPAMGTSATIAPALDALSEAAPGRRAKPRSGGPAVSRPAVVTPAVGTAVVDAPAPAAAPPKLTSEDRVVGRMVAGRLIRGHAYANTAEPGVPLMAKECAKQANVSITHFYNKAKQAHAAGEKTWIVMGQEFEMFGGGSVKVAEGNGAA